MNKITLLVLFVSICFSVFSQNVAITDDDTYTANPSSMLDVKSTTRGLLIPRVTTSQRNAILTPATGLLVFDTNIGGFYYYDGTSWINLSSGSSSGLLWSYNAPYLYSTSTTDNIGIGTSTPLHKLGVTDNVTVTDGTDGSFIDIENNQSTNGIMSGIRFKTNGSADRFKGGIFYQRTAAYGRGDFIFANNTEATSSNVTSSDARFVIRNTGGVEVKATSSAPANSSLFHVLNSAGDTIFAVYDGGVRINVYDDPLVKTTASKGGFAVGGFSPSKGTFTNEYLRITPDSIRMYIEEGAANKATASKGGFAVGGFSPSKSIPTDYFNIYGSAATTILNPSEARIFWYPLKEALLSGRVLVESPDSVGTNSFASGFESKPIGNYSQAMGYGCIARGDYSTAIGKTAIANSNNSFALGDGASALAVDAYAFGAGAKATGLGSYAFGSYGRDATGAPNAYITKASGLYSIAFGQGARAESLNSMSFGTNSLANGANSLSFGSNSTSTGQWSTSFGVSADATGDYSIALGTSNASGTNSISIGTGASSTSTYSIALGYGSLSSASYSMALGESAEATGAFAVAIQRARAYGVSSVAIGMNTESIGIFSFAAGVVSRSIGDNSVALGAWNDSYGGYSFTANGNNVANGTYSSAFGTNTNAKAYNSFVIGRYNDTTGTAASWVDSDPLFIVANGTNNSNRNNALTVLKNGNVGIGANPTTYKFHVENAASSASENSYCGYFKSTAGSTSGTSFGLRSYSYAYGTSTSYAVYANATGGTTSGSEWAFYGVGDNYFSGNVGIGTTVPAEKLHVIGNVKATTFIATTGTGAYKYNTTSNMNVPDYVFDKHFEGVSKENPIYKMLSISELKDYISKNRHLPRVPSRSEIEKDGAVNLQGLSMINLEKTEENSLYIIQLDEKINQLEIENKYLKNKNEDFQKTIDELNEKVEQINILLEINNKK